MMDSLELEVRKWAVAKGIFDNSTPMDQMDKMIEESSELDDEVVQKQLGMPHWSDEKIQGELGDVLVTCVIQAHFHGLSLQSCLQQALDKITKRTGQMIDGQFVKDNH